MRPRERENDRPASAPTAAGCRAPRAAVNHEEHGSSPGQPYAARQGQGWPIARTSHRHGAAAEADAGRPGNLPGLVLHLVADESTRAGYVLCIAAVAIDDVDAARTAMRGFLLAGQRSVHFKSERDARRRQILDTIANLGAETLIVSCASG